MGKAVKNQQQVSEYAKTQRALEELDRKFWDAVKAAQFRQDQESAAVRLEEGVRKQLTHLTDDTLRKLVKDGLFTPLINAEIERRFKGGEFVPRQEP